MMDADGSNQIPLTASLDPEYNPAWSPDGSKIAFDSGPRGGDIDIYVMTSDGSDHVRLTNATGRDMEPDW